MKKATTLYGQALSLAVAGYSIIPVGADKRPLLLSWKQYQVKAADDAQIEAWWRRFPSANIGIVTGRISGLIVIDIDTYKGAVDIFPETFTVQTGNGGLQKYYEYVEGFTISANGYASMPHVDIRSDGGYVVAAPSVTDYEDKGQHKGGAYIVTKNIPPAKFPTHLFPTKKPRKSARELVGVGSGSRNDSIASMIGQLLRAESDEKKWMSDVWPATLRINATYAPPLGETELTNTFNSIAKKERDRRAALVLSPIQIDDEQGRPIKIPIRRNSAGNPYKDMTNALAVLQHHPYFKGTLRYNQFRQDIEYKGKPIEDTDYLKMQYFMQKEMGLSSITREPVEAAVMQYAHENAYDEAQEWMQNLIWDKRPRLASWVASAIGVEDSEYHRAIGMHWFNGMVRRIMDPGCVFDHVLVITGKQGIGKTSLFRIIGGNWYKSYTGAIDNKDFYLALRGAMLMDLDEGSALNKSDSIKLKSVITSTHDEYRAPYARTMKKYPRRFVFSMSTNDTEPFRDVTGNRRYWTIDATDRVDFKWLEDNRAQLFAEAFHIWKNKIAIPDVPAQEALDNQEAHLQDDPWADLVMFELKKNLEYCAGSPEYFTTVGEIYNKIFPDKMDRFDMRQMMRMTTIFKKNAGFTKRRTMIDGERQWRWYFTPERAALLQKKNAGTTRSHNDDLLDDFNKK